jgi:hypothetical protein
MEGQMSQWTSLIGALALSLFLPVAIFLTRENVRIRRRAIVASLEGIFKFPQDNADAIVPSFEFVKYKYFPDSAPKTGTEAKKGLDERIAWAWYVPSVGFFCVICTLCVHMAFLMLPSEVAEALALPNCNRASPPYCIGRSFFLIGGNEHLSGPEAGIYAGRALTVATFAFLGAYLFAIRHLLKSVSNFDLSPLTFFRLGLHIVSACVAAVVLWRSGSQASELLPSVSTDNGLGAGWYAFAFLLGWIPDLGILYVARAVRIRFIKNVDSEALRETSIIPLELIDGIDQDVRFRLEEHNLYDVQNLATANPILLFVETPYGIYQSIDWVAQAQLATNVGVHRFIELRRSGFRTIFDLETILVGTAPEPLLKWIGGILDKRTDRESPGHDPGLFHNPQIVRHMMAMMCDDLHVQRLRQVKQVIEARLREGTEAGTAHAASYPEYG